jgi:ubiquinone biosynthesis protein
MTRRIRKQAGGLDGIRNRNPHRLSMFSHGQNSHSENASVPEGAVQIRTFLQNRGPVFASLALYLSSRLDAMPAEYCREFELTPDAAPVLPPSEVKRITEAELGVTFARSFAKFDFNPVKSGLFVQIHAAELRSGHAVHVMLARPECARTIPIDEIKQSLNDPTFRGFCASFISEELVADFLRALGRATDLRLRRQAMQTGPSGTTPRGKRIRWRIYSELSGQQVLTASSVEPAYLSQNLEAATQDGQRLARNLCHQWLYESLCGGFCPVDPRVDNMILREGEFTFAGNEFVELTQRSRENLRLYLLATLVDDPDQAARSLLQEMTPPIRGLREPGEFRSKFRQAAYFGALEPVLGTDANALSQLIFQHWKTAIDYGYAPTPHLLCFYRGLFSIARAARQLAPGADSLREGMEELEAAIALDQLSEVASAGYWSQNADKFVISIMNFPRELNDALSRVAEAESEPLPGADVSLRKSWSALARCVLLLAACVFIFQSDPSRWIERSAVLALMVTGLIASGALDR